ncbi:hypothetical protein PIROE2DRAFT_56944 [Piromyces sp. E2]|nr:hypothetical protein PIROE2DRAFT_56944 [Piromyces sp. E2]|eukprot:OUM70271.1 hypothetical protein PIROE2DRAFT_56944 [Piromyces sp. E2]
MVKVHFNEKIETVETYDAGDYDRTSVPIAELNEAEFNEMECYRLEMKKQTIEEYQKRWRKRSSTSTNETSSGNSSESENSSPILKSCLIHKNSSDSNKINASTINTAVPISIPSSLEEESNFFREGQAQPNIVLNTPHSSDYNSDEFRQAKNDAELSSGEESNLEIQNKEEKINVFTEPEQDEIEINEVMDNENRQNNAIISPLSFNSTDSPSSDNDADVESEDDNNSFIRVLEDSFETKNNKDDDESDYIKDMSFSEGENSISLSHQILSDDIPTTSFHSSNHRLFTDSLFNTSPILSVAALDKKEQIQGEEGEKENIQKRLVEEPEDEESELEEKQKQKKKKKMMMKLINILILIHM